MPKPHLYRAHVAWTGASAGPTSGYRAYSRAFTAHVAGKPPLHGSADVPFVGDATLHNPEDLLLIALASCHMLSFLSVCARQQPPIVVASYEDHAEASMTWDGTSYRFSEVVLRPRAVIASGDRATATALHDAAHALCFIARSVNFPVWHEPQMFAAAHGAADVL